METPNSTALAKGTKALLGIARLARPSFGLPQKDSHRCGLPTHGILTTRILRTYPTIDNIDAPPGHNRHSKTIFRGTMYGLAYHHRCVQNHSH